MKKLIIYLSLIATVGFSADVILGRLQDLTWTGTGADRVASFGQALTNGCFTPFVMTATNTPSPYVCYANFMHPTYQPTYQIWKAFDNDANTGWCGYPNTASNGLISIDIAVARVATSYSVQAKAGDNAYTPNLWKFEASNDNTNWTTLDERTNEISWGATETRTYAISNTQSYRFYRWSNIAGKTTLSQDEPVFGELDVYGLIP